jgi:hypothetical protein
MRTGGGGECTKMALGYGSNSDANCEKSGSSFDVVHFCAYYGHSCAGKRKPEVRE